MKKSNLNNHLIIAMPHLNDTIFNKSVILVIQTLIIFSAGITWLARSRKIRNVLVDIVRVGILPRICKIGSGICTEAIAVVSCAIGPKIDLGPYILIVIDKSAIAAAG